MNRTNRDRHELIEDIFTPEDAAPGVSADAVVKAISRAKERRRRRRQLAGSAAALVAAGGIWAASLSFQNAAGPRESSRPIAAARPAVAEAKTITPPEVERVDDEDMLAMIDQQPAALARWPDGRQTLLLLVARPEK